MTRHAQLLLEKLDRQDEVRPYAEHLAQYEGKDTVLKRHVQAANMMAGPEFLPGDYEP